MTQVNNQVTTVFSAVDNISRTTANIDKNIGALTKSFTKLSGAFQNAFQFYVRFRIFGIINQGISAIENAIPGLISKGQEWARTVDAIADATGLAAQESSALAGVANILVGSTEGLARALGALAVATTNHGDKLRRYGIQTRAANGDLLDTWTVLGNVRRALNETGNSFITTAAARELFSRGGQTLIDILTMSDRQFRMLTDDVKASGSVMSEQGLRVAEAWERTSRRLEQQITGVANTLVQALGPSIMRFVDQVTEFIRANLKQIVEFLASVVSAVVNFAAGFLGIDLGLESFAEKLDKAGGSSDRTRAKLGRFAQTKEQMAKSEDHHSDAIKRQIDAIDRQIAAMGRQSSAEEARRQQRELLNDIAEGKKELEDIRSKSIFAAGMSNLEAELARQQQTADIEDAQKRIAESRQKLAEHNRKVAMDERRFELEQRKAGLQEQLAAHMKAIAARAQASEQAMGQILGGKGIGKLPGDISAAMSGALTRFKEVGPEFWGMGEDFRLAMQGLGEKLGGLWESVKENLPSWITSLQEIGRHIGNVAETLSKIVDRIADANPFGPGEGKINLGISPADILAGGGLLFAAKKLGLLGFAGRAAGPAGAAGAALIGAERAAAIGAKAATGKVVLSALGGPVAVAAIASAIVDEVVPRGKGPFKDPLANRQTGLDVSAGITKSLQDLGDDLSKFVFGNPEAENLKATATQTKLAASRLTAKGGSTADWAQQSASFLGQLANPRPGTLFGMANVTIVLPNGSFVVGVNNVPLRTGNSSLRPNRNQ